MKSAIILLPLVASLAQVATAFPFIKRAAAGPDLARANNERSGSFVHVRGQDSKRLVRRKRPHHDWETSTPCTTSTDAPSATSSASWSSDDNSSSDSSSSSSDSNPNTGGNLNASPPASGTRVSTGSAPQSTSAWQHVETISGQNFFDQQYWNFWSYPDPTHGTVNYVDGNTARSQGLISVNGQGQAIMKVDTTPQVQGGRNSVRIHSNRIWTGGMVILDAAHMPTGCGTWPAWWQNGPNWPEGGEIDILEGVNDNTNNQVSLHTGVGCTMPNNLESNQLGTMSTGNFNPYDCSSANTQNQGCGVIDRKSANSYGAGFNSAGGGVYALAWAKSGIKVWFFTRSAVPQDITSGSPNPDGWGTPVANFPSDNCNPYQFFYDQFNIFDTTLCGDWAGADSVWSQSCAASTGFGSCSDYVLNSGASFEQAYWAVNSVTYYNSTTLV
ncbi:putative glycosidase [Vanrija pseudolonga]|uniref:Glycosidase n=1 Tax=Vanrija pseudolonga TaxID=143232 RepID=A0AAF1BTE8_9TREE|nr:putative glycosidase [Vanrija pseudolonga]